MYSRPALGTIVFHTSIFPKTFYTLQVYSSKEVAAIPSFSHFYNFQLGGSVYIY